MPRINTVRATNGKVPNSFVQGTPWMYHDIFGWMTHLFKMDATWKSHSLFATLDQSTGINGKKQKI